jgi:nucleotide-binding universal stress UspA family protein
MVFVRERAGLGQVRAHRAAAVYRTVVVPLGDDLESLLAVPTACALAAPDGGSLVGVFIIEVPTELPLEAHMFDAEGHARDALGRAREAAEAYGLRFSGRIVSAHGAAEAILAEAERLGADLIVLAARRRKTRRLNAPPFDEDVRTVLAEAPCRVLVIAPPGPAGDSGARG